MNLMLKIILPVLLLLSLVPFGNAYIVNGTVTDDCTGATVDGVVLYFINASHVNTTTTSASGVYTIGYSDYDDYANGSLTVTYGGESGYFEESATVTVAGNTTQNITFSVAYCAVYGPTDIGTSTVDFLVTILVLIVGFGSLVALIVVYKFYKGKKIGF